MVASLSVGASVGCDVGIKLKGVIVNVELLTAVKGSLSFIRLTKRGAEKRKYATIMKNVKPGGQQALQHVEL